MNEIHPIYSHHDKGNTNPRRLMKHPQVGEPLLSHTNEVQDIKKLPHSLLDSQMKFSCYSMAHRGCSMGYIENTLPAFRYAASLNVDLLELDVQETQDGQIVIFHDKDLQRLCGINKRTADYKYEELPRLLIPPSLQLQLSFAKNTNRDMHRIPLLRELIEEFPKYPMQIDLKTASEVFIHKVARLIQEFDRWDITLWGSFRFFTYRRILGLYPNTHRFFGFHQWVSSRLLYQLGLLKYMKYKEKVAILPATPFYTNRGYVSTLQKLGLKVIFFGNLNSFSEYKRMDSLGADGICTDDPLLLKEWSNLTK